MAQASAYEVLLTQGAEEDLESLYDYMTVHRSPEKAEALLDALAGKVETLEAFSTRGTVPKELAALGIREFRQLLHAPYRIVYKIVDGMVFVVLIADGRRDMRALLEQRLLGGG
ncbi:type II toxin-antitoxin system RelE/ParE family toxin [Sphingosinicella sp. LHD-64]|uniref:type II toxin-antitoxin system RelE/ParE family toxin n=1 Tax=Sphingosinicella sp. LHD-64 TaxID=3072139 RepID=UPI00280FBD55|nr:type II toxin-antitoxin system RelE/ParE family toxin [Sphingosinicella sp. LHD-64]MDQ8758218.1 type II toxin-antitoxin system RelE/ParE family toxin [Sphingosinicella sp. LHD-64]